MIIEEREYRFHNKVEEKIDGRKVRGVVLRLRNIVRVRRRE